MMVGSFWVGSQKREGHPLLRVLGHFAQEQDVFPDYLAHNVTIPKERCIRHVVLYLCPDLGGGGVYLGLCLSQFLGLDLLAVGVVDEIVCAVVVLLPIDVFSSRMSPGKPDTHSRLPLPPTACQRRRPFSWKPSAQRTCAACH